MQRKIITIITAILFTLTMLISQSINVKAANDNKLNIYLFYGEGCPHCAKEREFLKDIRQDYSDEVEVYEFEIYYDYENADLFNKVTNRMDTDIAGVPFLVVGNQYIVGYGSDSTTGEDIQNLINNCLEEKCSDPMAEIIFEKDSEDIEGNEDNNDNGDEILTNASDDSKFKIDIPLAGTIDLKSLSLPIATFLIAFMDGFNPCAMWILIFLISMLINMKDKKKLYTLGTIFIITSAAVYFVFLAAWFNFFKLIGYTYWIKVIIGLVAIFSGYMHIKSGLFSKGECTVINRKQKKSIMQRIKDIIKEQKYSIAIIGIISLAISVNLIEVICSAGLPSVYTNLLSTIEMSTLEYYSLLLFYIFIFMLDDLVVFFLAVKTFQVAGITSKYTKWSNLIGGFVIFIIGFILILKPDLLMFG